MIATLFSTGVKHLLRFTLPWACAGCRATLSSTEDDGFCGRCWLAIPRIQGLICRQCGLPLKEGGERCYDCQERPLRLPVRSAVEFSGPVRRAIHRLKYGGRKSLARAMAVLLESAWDRYPEVQKAHALVPVPLHYTQKRERGFNQAAELACELGFLIGKPVLEGLLTRTRQTRPQAQLSKYHRLLNVTGAFGLLKGGEQLAPRLKGKSLLIIDDVCTTGRTLEACAEPLRRAGVRWVRALTLARDL